MNAVVLMLRYLSASSKPWTKIMRNRHIFQLEIIIRVNVVDVVGAVRVPHPGT